MSYLLSKFIIAAHQVGDACDPNADASLVDNFFGFKPWYHYLDGKFDAFEKCIPEAFTRTGDTTYFNSIWLIALAMVDNVLKIAALVAIGFVIYGGIEMIVSNGNPEQINKGRNTAINALVGLFIALLASAVVSFLGLRLGL